jgi:antitoxin (DNA-binding transcriptional repressor) of toxin-antitoxin stability system
VLLIDKFESDNLIFMRKTMTATEVARNFSAVLDSVEAGDEIEITRGKKVVATLKREATKKNGAALIAMIEQRHAKYGPMDDETYDAFQQVLAERHAPHNLVGGELDRDPWAE